MPPNMMLPFRRMGGKGNLYKIIHRFFPKKFETYIEPFCGTCAVGMNQFPIPPCEIYNDLDKNVYSLFAVLTNEIKFAKFKDRVSNLISHQ